MGNVKCIDISHWQGRPDFQKVRAAGVLAVIHKATEGTSYKDPDRAANCHAAIQAGIKVCTYHWLKPGNNAVEQMTHYLRTIDPVPGERVIIDYEEAGCDLVNLKVAMQYLLADPRRLQVTIYSGHLIKQQLGDKRDDYLAAHTSLWLAQYTEGAVTWPKATWPRWTLHQYTDKGAVDGISDAATVDLNRFNGHDANLLKWVGPPQPS